MRDISAEIMPVGVLPEHDTEMFAEWMWRQKDSSNFDPDVIAAPTACMVKVTQGDKAIAYMPVQTVICLESLCNAKDLSKSQISLAIYEIHLLVKKMMADSGIAEAFFTTSNDGFADLCEGQGWKKHLFDESKHTWLMKLQIAGQL